MILNRTQIKKEMELGNILVEPLKEEYIGVNSIDLRLGKDLKVYEDFLLDPHCDNPTMTIEIPEEGLQLVPGELYLATTKEYTETKNHVPLIVGRSSIGRLGIFVHITAGFGDVGFKGQWTLEITCVKPVILYPDMKIAQIYYNTTGESPEEYSGRYQNQKGVEASKYHMGETYFEHG